MINALDSYNLDEIFTAKMMLYLILKAFLGLRGIIMLH